MGSAQVQGALWGARAKDWAEVQEGMVRPLYQAVLTRANVGAGVTLLSEGLAVRAIEQRGEEAVKDAVLKALEPFKTPNGGYHLRNKFLYLVARA